VSGSLVDDVRDFRTRGPLILMISYGALADSSPEAGLAAPMISSISHRPWRRAALLRAGAAQLITISAPGERYPVSVSCDAGRRPVEALARTSANKKV